MGLCCLWWWDGSRAVEGETSWAGQSVSGSGLIIKWFRLWSCSMAIILMDILDNRMVKYFLIIIYIPHPHPSRLHHCKLVLPVLLWNLLFNAFCFFWFFLVAFFPFHVYVLRLQTQMSCSSAISLSHGRD